MPTKEPSKERGCLGKMRLKVGNMKSKALALAHCHCKQYGIYDCPHCKGFHLTTKLNNKAKYAPLVYVTPQLPPEY